MGNRGRPAVRENEAHSSAQTPAQTTAPSRELPQRRQSLRDAPGWLSSLLLHAALLSMFGLITVVQQLRDPVPELTMKFGESEPIRAEETFELVTDDLKFASVESQELEVDAQDADGDSDLPISLEEITSEELVLDTDQFDPTDVVPSDFVKQFSGRTKAGRAALVAREGGTPASEASVALGLQWLANHQLNNGSWSYDHTGGSCQGRCAHPGHLSNCTTGATGMALLCFLSAGHTEDAGEYKPVVRRGLKYLKSQMRNSRRNSGDLRGRVIRNEGLYAHGIATLALCEAHSMAANKKMRQSAQKAINFIVQAQDPRGGGWRYQPRQPGDTSVVGWQVMALHSGFIGELEIPRSTLDKAWQFLDSVQSEDGVTYGYMGRGRNSPTLSAVGLLCRMYLGQNRGWDTTHPAVIEGAARIGELGPSRDDMYYNYYATQFMYQVGGEHWRLWNNIMRDQLVDEQEKSGHAAGSWRPTCPHGRGPGGRLYMTAMCVLTLEVYYRHLPIYRNRGVDPADDASAKVN